MPFIQCDSSAVEAVMVGYYMGGANGAAYINLAKRGIHDFLCCKHLGWEFTPENKAKVKKEHDALRSRKKTVVHGVGFGMRPYMMHMNDPETFPTLRSAREEVAFLFKSIPGLGDWQREVRERAQKEGYLTNAWGLKHYFYDVCTFAYDDEGNVLRDDEGNPKIKHGKDSNRSIASLPQSSNGLFQRDNVLILAVTPIDGEPPSLDAAEVVERWAEFEPSIAAGKTWQRFMPANLSVHDSICLDTPVSLVDSAVEVLRKVMTRPVPELQGLTIGAECEVGDNWLDMSAVAAWPMLEAA